MSALLPRLAAGSVSAALALLVLGAPTVALAAPGNETAQSRAGSAQERPTPQATAAAGAAGGAAAGRSAAAPATNPASKPAAKSAAKPAAKPAPRDDQRGRSDAARKKAEQARAVGDKGGAQSNGRADSARAQAPKAPVKPAEDAATADPRGNNGTFKVDGPVLDTGHGNEPHVACAFRLNFFGYDAGQLANISFTAIAPTTGGSTTVSGTPVISTTAAKGGVYGGSYPVTGTWTAADLGLDPTQAQHVKVSVESLNADGSQVPGGAKHKVFWLEPCAAAEAGTATLPAEQAPAPTAGTTAAAPATGVMGPFALPRQMSAPAQPAAAQMLTASAAAPAAAVVAQGAFGPQLLLPQGTARTVSQPATLPFTGSPQLVALLVGGLVALVFGGGLIVAARRSA